MYIYEVTKAKLAIERKCESLQEEYEKAESKARAYYSESVLPAEDDTAVSDEEWEAICSVYDDLCATVKRLGEQIDIAVNAIAALFEVKSALLIAEAEGVWKEG